MSNIQFAKPFFWGTLKTADVDGGHWLLLEPFRFFSLELGQTVVAPKGFVTDLSSIPRGLWNVFPKTGPYDYAAVIHDAAYEGQLQDVGGRPFLVTKLQADRLFLEGMEARGIGKVRRTLMYWGVRKFGKGHFPKEILVK